ncbi:broad-complex core protein isoform [Anaeramoeba flamelloides]|uniref:Broad-complex core protein isoform n=1 Tax=Anaeramoeba flamelloides TaxID=1746091 RepID=A0AAV7ZIM5_9EUKA|nr:broad-complex core protein isoform [Anaeramoeba flamelloides]
MKQKLTLKNRLNLLSENLFNKILERMEISIHYQSSSFSITSKFFLNMVCCLYKLNLFVGTNFEKSNNNYNMISDQQKMTNNVIIDNSNINNKNKVNNNIGRNINNQNINMDNNNNNSNNKDENSKSENNNNFNLKKITIGKFQIMKLFYIIEKCLDSDLEFCKNILNSIRYLLKVASVQLEVYNDPNFHSQLLKFCSHQDFNFNKIAWKTFYQMIITNSKLTSILVKNELKLYINNLNTNLTNSSNGLHYLNKIFTMAASEKLRMEVLNLSSRRKNQKNSLHSMKKDQKKLIDALVKRHFVLRFNLLVKKQYKNYLTQS